MDILKFKRDQYDANNNNITRYFLQIIQIISKHIKNIFTLFRAHQRRGWVPP